MDACKHLHALAFLYPIDAPDLSPPSQDEKAALENLPLEAGQVAKADAFLAALLRVPNYAWRLEAHIFRDEWLTAAQVRGDDGEDGWGSGRWTWTWT